MSEALPLPKDEPQTRESLAKVEVVTPKLESPTLDVKEELGEQEADDQKFEVPQDELPRNREEVPPHDSEGSLDPEHVADELRRLTEAPAQLLGSVSPHGSGEGATAPTWEKNAPYTP